MAENQHPAPLFISTPSSSLAPYLPHMYNPYAMEFPRVMEEKQERHEEVDGGEDEIEVEGGAEEEGTYDEEDEEGRRREDDDETLQLSEEFLEGRADATASVIAPACMRAREAAEMKVINSLTLLNIITRIVKKVVQKYPVELVFSKQMFIRNNWLSKQTYAVCPRTTYKKNTTTL